MAAAGGGARSTVSVDVSPKHLRWGRENFECNGLDFANHEFLCDETQTYLRRSARRQRHFDMIIIDPPTFAHSRKSKKNFSITRDLRELIADAVAVLKPGGAIMVSTNNRRISRRDLLDLVRRGVGTRKFQTVASPPLPTDFAPDRDYAKTLFLRID